MSVFPNFSCETIRAFRLANDSPAKEYWLVTFITALCISSWKSNISEISHVMMCLNQTKEILRSPLATLESHPRWTRDLPCLAYGRAYLRFYCSTLVWEHQRHEPLFATLLSRNSFFKHNEALNWWWVRYINITDITVPFLGLIKGEDSFRECSEE